MAMFESDKAAKPESWRCSSCWAARLRTVFQDCPLEALKASIMPSYSNGNAFSSGVHPSARNVRRSLSKGTRVLRRFAASLFLIVNACRKLHQVFNFDFFPFRERLIAGTA